MEARRAVILRAVQNFSGCKTFEERKRFADADQKVYVPLKSVRAPIFHAHNVHQNTRHEG